MSHKATAWAMSLRGLCPGEFRVIMALADCHNPARGCFPSGAHLRDTCEMSNGALYENLKKLEAKGHIARVRRGDAAGQGRAPTLYILGFEGDQTPETGDRPDSGETEIGCTLIPVGRRPDSGGPETEPVREPVTEEEPVKERVEPSRPSRQSPGAASEAFEVFWNVYPHRNGTRTKKAAAREKFLAAVKRGVDPQDIVDGARRAQNDPDVRRGYGRGPVPWLNQSGWEDEIANPGPSHQFPRSLTSIESARTARIEDENRIIQATLERRGLS